MSNSDEVLIKALSKAIEVITDQVEALKSRVDDLEAENQCLLSENLTLAKTIETLKRAPVLTDPIKWPTILPTEHTQWYGNCPKCGLKLDSVMGYVCPNAGCPTGLGGAWCSTSTEPSGPGR